MASQQFCLKWNNHTNNMLNIFENLLTTETFVDVTLACDGLSLKAHKMVLSACSPFFQSLFLENPCKHPVIIMKDMNYKDLKAIVDFMYHGEVNVSQDQLSALLKTAETLKVKGLAEVSGENRQSSGLVQQEIATPQQNSVPIPSSSSTPQQQPPVMQQRRAESPPLHGKRKRGRPRKRSLSDSNRSDDEMVPTKIKEPDSPEIEELSGDASMEGNESMLRQGSNSSQGPIHSSVNSFSRRSHSNAQIEEPPSGEENEFEVEPSKLLEQTLTTDNVPSMSNAASSSTISSANFNLPSSSGMEISQVGVSDNNTALVPVSGTSDSLSSSHLQGPDSPQDIKPAILTFEDSPISPAPGTSQSMVYMDQSSMPGTSYQDNSLVQHDAQPQDRILSSSQKIISNASFDSLLSDKSEKIYGLQKNVVSNVENLQQTFENPKLQESTELIDSSDCNSASKTEAQTSHVAFKGTKMCLRAKPKKRKLYMFSAKNSKSNKSSKRKLVKTVNLDFSSKANKSISSAANKSISSAANKSISSEANKSISSVNNNSPSNVAYIYQCNICPYFTSQCLKSVISHLKCHSVAHFSNCSGKVDCPVCKQYFHSTAFSFQHPESGHLKSSKPLKKSEKRYMCRYCKEGFWSSYEAAQHEMKAHINKISVSDAANMVANSSLCGKPLAPVTKRTKTKHSRQLKLPILQELSKCRRIEPRQENIAEISPQLLAQSNDMLQPDNSVSNNSSDNLLLEEIKQEIPDNITDLPSNDAFSLSSEKPSGIDISISLQSINESSLLDQTIKEELDNSI